MTAIGPFVTNDVQIITRIILSLRLNNVSRSSFVSRRAASAAAQHRPEGAVLRGLPCVRPGHQPHRPLPQRRRHPGPVQRVRRDVQHALHHPLQPHRRVPAPGGGEG